MINSIMSMGKHVIVGGGNSSSNYINTGAGMMGVGDLRFNTSTQQIEFYNGQTWQIFTMAQATVGLTGTAETAIDWAMKKMEEEKEARAMAEQYPAVADAMGAVREAEQQLKTVVALCRV
jgi:flagellar hook-basal body complex protein FliE